MAIPIGLHDGLLRLHSSCCTWYLPIPTLQIQHLLRPLADRVHELLHLSPSVGRMDDHSQAGLALGHDGIVDGEGTDPSQLQMVAQPKRVPLASHDWDNLRQEWPSLPGLSQGDGQNPLVDGLIPDGVLRDGLEKVSHQVLDIVLQLWDCQWLARMRWQQPTGCVCPLAMSL